MTVFVYILQSRLNNSFYKGSTDNLQRRIAQHNDFKNESTSRYAPWDLVWYCVKPNRAEAVTLEKKLKNLSGDAGRTINIQLIPTVAKRSECI